MTIDWDQLQKDLFPLKNFEALGVNLGESFSYAFVQQIFNFSMAQMEEYARQVLGGDTRQRYAAYLVALTTAFRQMEAAGVRDVHRLVALTHSRSEFAAFCEAGGVAPGGPASVLKFINYWFVPTKKYLNELGREEDGLADAIAELRPCGIRFNLDLLERGRTPAGRVILAENCGLSEVRLADLVNRADFSRLPWSSKATISNYVGAGYGSLARLAGADPQQLNEDFYRFGQSIGKNLKHGNEIDNGQRIARIVPRIVIEEQPDDLVR